MQIYIYERADKKIITQYGHISYLDFLEKEKARIEKTPGRVVIIKKQMLSVGLFVEKIQIKKIKK